MEAAAKPTKLDPKDDPIVCTSCHHSPQILHTQRAQYPSQGRLAVAPRHAQGQPSALAKPPPRALDDAGHVAAEMDARVWEGMLQDVSDGAVLVDEGHEHGDRVAFVGGQDQVVACA